MEILKKYFLDLNELQISQFERLEYLYRDWNSKINLISRKDLEKLYLRHVLHSLGIAKVQTFKKASNILDVGTGGGFPGIPLAILFPETQFYLVDSIGKKIKAVENISQNLGLKNLRTDHIRAEKVKGKFDFVVGRAVTTMPNFVKWVREKIEKKQQNHKLKNGILYLKGGNIIEEFSLFKSITLYNLSDFFTEDFFKTKKILHLPL